MNAPTKTNTHGKPFASNNLRESQWGPGPGSLPDGASVTLATLRSQWVYVGFMVDPGDAAAVGLVAKLKVLEPGLVGFTAEVAIAATRLVQAFPALTLGSRAELVVTNRTGAPVTGLRGAIWGMSRG